MSMMLKEDVARVLTYHCFYHQEQNMLDSPPPQVLVESRGAGSGVLGGIVVSFVKPTSPARAEDDAHL